MRDILKSANKIVLLIRYAALRQRQKLQQKTQRFVFARNSQIITNFDKLWPLILIDYRQLNSRIIITCMYNPDSPINDECIDITSSQQKYRNLNIIVNTRYIICTYHIICIYRFYLVCDKPIVLLECVLIIFKTFEIEKACGILLLFSYASKNWKMRWNKRENFVSE